MMPYHIEELIAHWRGEWFAAHRNEDAEYEAFCASKIKYYEDLLDEWN